MTMLELWAKGILNIGDYIPNFHTDYRECILKKESTGWNEDQLIHTENELRYRFAGLWQGSLVLLSDKVTEQKIILNGKVGYENGDSAIESLHEKCYSSEKFHGKGFFIPPEFFDKLPDELKIDGTFWLNSYYEYSCDDLTLYSVYMIRKDNIPDYALWLDYYKEDSCISDGGILPAVLLPRDTLMDENHKTIIV